MSKDQKKTEEPEVVTEEKEETEVEVTVEEPKKKGIIQRVKDLSVPGKIVLGVLLGGLATAATVMIVGLASAGAKKLEAPEDEDIPDVHIGLDGPQDE